MSLPIHYLPQAEADIDAAFSWYEKSQPGLGVRFVQALEEQLSLIQGNPLMYSVIHHDVRACLVPKFLYVIYYRIEPGCISLLAVQHGHDNPAKWRSRV